MNAERAERAYKRLCEAIQAKNDGVSRLEWLVILLEDAGRSNDINPLAYSACELLRDDLLALFDPDGLQAERGDRPRVVCLCGSTRFKEAFIEANFRETMAGRIVLSVGWFSHADGHVYTPTPEEKRELDALHCRKIDLADEVLVLDVGGYIGESTRNEIRHAEATGKPVRYLSQEVPDYQEAAAVEPVPEFEMPESERRQALLLASGNTGRIPDDLDHRCQVLTLATELALLARDWNGDRS